MSNLTEKAIGKLLEFNFFIPSYQRGFRWTERQVEDLLNDVWDFITKTEKKYNEWYCLQPVVVKKINNYYEVLDGQQRLTTIFLILKHLEPFIESERKSFEIEYETRNTENYNSKLFLQSIDKKSENDSSVNIDYFHIFQAYKKIKEWFQTKANQGYNSISSKFITPFLESTKVIWYKVDSGKDAIEIFTRINMGKIPLTNAELIKALFLNSSNFHNSDTEKIRLRQLEIASEWDRIEYSLQNDELWYFINNSANELPTRIEYIFEIIKNIEGIQNGNDQYSTFRFFSDKFKTNTKDEIDNNWKEIKRTFQTIEEWFLDRELYHKVGFLITAGEKITELLNEAQKRQKNDFKKFLDSKITEKVKCDNLEELEYGKDNLRIKNILLLHNILTMLSNENETSRFPFDRFKKEKKEKWDIEHIHAIATEVKVNQDAQKEWLENNFSKCEHYNDDKLNSEIDEIVKNNKTVSDEDFQKIIEYVLGEEDNSIRNLCLLDMGTNRSYKNDSFKNKRNKIIKNEKEGTFIPVCTRNVFMKYYSSELKDLELWNEHDRDEYIKDIENVVYSLNK